MRFIKKIIFFQIIIALFTIQNIFSQIIEKNNALNALVQSEKNFAKDCLEKGTKEGFLLNLDDNSIVFHPKPVLGKEVYRNRKESKSVLNWIPEYAEVASSLDFGYTTGPWEFKRTPGDTPVAYGHYVSIWHKTQDSTWKVLIDIGINHGKTSLDIKIPLTYSNGNKFNIQELPYNNYIKEKKKLLEMEKTFSEDAEKNGLSYAFYKHAADKIRTLRDGKFPIYTKEKTRDAFLPEKRKMSWTPIEANIALSGDLGYTYGIVESRNEKEAAKIDSSSYLRIWRKSGDGSFKIALDICIPINEGK